MSARMFVYIFTYVRLPLSCCDIVRVVSAVLHYVMHSVNFAVTNS